MGADLVTRAAGLLSQFQILKTFDDVQRWDRSANALAAELGASVGPLEAQIAACRSEAREHASRRAALPIFKRWFTSREPELAANRRADELTRTLQDVGETMNQLLEFIDYSPNNDKERKLLLKELRLQKKEMQARKKEVAAAKRAIHREAKEASANAKGGFFFYDAKMAAEERRAIRRQRYAALAPHEDAAAAIERQLMALDRQIRWVQRFGQADEGLSG